MNIQKRRSLGFSLLEMILVLVIMSSVLALIANYTQNRVKQFMRDKTALQMQQILNAAMAYYVSNGKWPIVGAGGVGTCPSVLVAGEPLTATQTLETAFYLPSMTMNNPWQNPYLLNCSTTGGVNYFTIKTDVVDTTNSNILVGQLPLASVTGTTVTAQVTVPGQNLNNARSVNYANLYHHGACIPVPTCPTGMTASVFVVPASITGLTDLNLTVYPITSFTAYVTGGTAGNAAPNDCDNDTLPTPCISTVPGTPTTRPVGPTTPTGLYWRACVNIQTTQGDVASNLTAANAAGTPANNYQKDWGQYVSVVAFTRCVPNGEAVGSDFTVWTN